MKVFMELNQLHLDKEMSKEIDNKRQVKKKMLKSKNKP
jgi:hypothetical protein